jgi:hypothetical protein
MGASCFAALSMTFSYLHLMQALVKYLGHAEVVGIFARGVEQALLVAYAVAGYVVAQHVDFVREVHERGYAFGVYFFELGYPVQNLVQVGKHLALAGGVKFEAG